MALPLRRQKESRRDLSLILPVSLLFLLCISIEVCSRSGSSFGVDAALIPSVHGASWDARDYDFSLDVMKRDDICSESLPGSVSSNCTPSNTSATTLCCVRPDSVFPQCGVYLGVGFCVVDDSGGSYTDTESVCDTDPNPVQCESDNGDAYCCPEHTTCPEDGVSGDLLRCEASTSDLEALTATSTTSTTSAATTTRADTTTTDATSSATNTASKTSDILGPITNPPSQNKPVDEDDGGSLSGGAVAGIAIAAFVILVLVALLIWFLIKRRKNAGGVNEVHGQANGNASRAFGYFGPDRKSGFMKHEMDAEGTALPRPLHELDPQSRATSVSRSSPQELATPIEDYNLASTNARPQSPQEMEAAPVSTFSPFRDQNSQSR